MKDVLLQDALFQSLVPELGLPTFLVPKLGLGTQLLKQTLFATYMPETEFLWQIGD
ncbi:hypothetical protein QUF58_05790 [Anaerolineales bacterium HSG24]|nr:hypothetical protein [Anaerolineales bacterium HSG24]